MTKEDLSLWKYKRVCVSCKKEFGTDRPERKQRCFHCTHHRKKDVSSKLLPKSLRVPGKYDGIYKRTKTGWQWE